MNKFYTEMVLPNGKYSFTLMGILRKESFLAQPHLHKFIVDFKYTNNGFVTILECDNAYSYGKIKKILDSNLNEQCFLNEEDEFRFKLVS